MLKQLKQAWGMDTISHEEYLEAAAFIRVLNSVDKLHFRQFYNAHTESRLKSLAAVAKMDDSTRLPYYRAAYITKKAHGKATTEAQ